MKKNEKKKKQLSVFNLLSLTQFIINVVPLVRVIMLLNLTMLLNSPLDQGFYAYLVIGTWGA